MQWRRRKGNAMPKYLHRPTNENVNLEKWRWEAYYRDDSVLFQFDDNDKTFHQFNEIDQQHLSVFKMVSDTEKPVTVLFPAGGKLVHKYVNTILNAGTPDEQRSRMYAFGYQFQGQNHFVVITPTNEVVITDDFDNVRVA